MHVKVLGSVTVVDDSGAAVVVGGRQQLRLLASLLAAPGRALLDAATCHRRGTLTGSHTAGRVLFSPDGRQVIARSLDGIRMWDTTTGRQVGDPLLDPSESLLGPGFAGGRLVSAAADELLTVFDLDPATWFSKACATAGRNLTHDEWNRYVGKLGTYRATCAEYPVGT